MPDIFIPTSSTAVSPVSRDVSAKFFPPPPPPFEPYAKTLPLIEIKPVFKMSNIFQGAASSHHRYAPFHSFVMMILEFLPYSFHVFLSFSANLFAIDLFARDYTTNYSLRIILESS